MPSTRTHFAHLRLESALRNSSPPPALTALHLEEDHFFIDTEIVVQLHRAGYRYRQTGVRHYPRTSGKSTVRPTDVPRTFLALLKLWAKLRLFHSNKAKLAARD